MTERRYIQKHIRERRARTTASTIDTLKTEYARLGREASELEFRTALMPDGLPKVKAMLLACELYIRREDVALKIDYRLAKKGNDQCPIPLPFAPSSPA